MDRSVEPDPSVAKMERWRATVDQVFKAVFKQEIEVKLEGDNAIDVGGLVTIAYQRRTSEDAKSNAPQYDAFAVEMPLWSPSAPGDCVQDDVCVTLVGIFATIETAVFSAVEQVAMVLADQEMEWNGC